MSSLAPALSRPLIHPLSLSALQRSARYVTSGWLRVPVETVAGRRQPNPFGIKFLISPNGCILRKLGHAGPMITETLILTETECVPGVQNFRGNQNFRDHVRLGVAHEAGGARAISRAAGGRAGRARESGRRTDVTAVAAGHNARMGTEVTGGGCEVLALPGARLAYQVTGEGPAVVLVHGFGLDMRMWDPQAAHLAARHQVIRYDCRGFGSSGPFDPAVAYTHAGDLLALLDHLGIERAVLAGLSFGGQVALRAALAAPQRVRGLVLMDAVVDGVPWDRESRVAIRLAGEMAQTRGLLAGRAAWLAHPLFASARNLAEVSDQLAAMVAAYPGQHWIGRDPHEEEGPRPLDVLEELAMPVLVMAGEHDVPGFLEMSAVLARRIPGARYHVVADAGHMINMEQPVAVNEVLTRFVDELPPPEEARPGPG
jgi:3-oxoadipate enol-lactonase